MTKEPKNRSAAEVDCTKCVHCRPSDEPHVWYCLHENCDPETLDKFEPVSEGKEGISGARENRGGY